MYSTGKIMINPEYINDTETIDEYESRLYDDFRTNFVDKNTRVKFNNDFIYVETPFIDGKSKQFYHIIGIDVSNINHMFLCDAVSANKCLSACDNSIKSVPFYTDRAHCAYRLARVNYIHKIIQLANQNDPSVNAWRSYKFNAQNQREDITNLLFSSRNEHYVVILKEITNRTNPYYFFIAAYPLLDQYGVNSYRSNFAHALTIGTNYY